MDVQQKKAAILDALLEHKGIEHIMSAASRILGNPVMANARTGALLGRSMTDEFDARYWERFDAAMPFGQVARELDEMGIASRLMTTDEVVCARFDLYECDFVGTRIRDRVDVLGAICIIAEHPLDADDEDELIALARVTAMEIVYQSETASQRDSDSALVKDLLTGAIGERELSSIMMDLQLNIGMSMRLFCACYPSKTDLALYLAKSAVKMNADCPLCGINGTNVVAIASEEQCSQGLADVLLQCTRGCDGVGLSAPFASLLDVPEAYEQAISAVRLSRALRRGGPLFRYEDVFSWRLIEAALHNGGPERCVDPIVAQAIAHDEANDTELTQTLRAYIETGCNLSECAKRLFAHRNTVHYRLKRIEELFGIDFSDDERNFAIGLSFRAIDLINNTSELRD